MEKTDGKTPLVSCFAKIALPAEQTHSFFSGEKQVHNAANYEAFTVGKENIDCITRICALKSNMAKSTKEFQ